MWCVLLVFPWIKCVILSLPRKSRYFGKKTSYVQYNLVYFYLCLFTASLFSLNYWRQFRSNSGTFQTWITSVLSFLYTDTVLPVLQSYTTLTLYIYLKYFPLNRSYGLLILVCFRILGWLSAHPIWAFLLQTHISQIYILFILIVLAMGWGVHLNQC